MKLGDIVVAGSAWGRVRALINDLGEHTKAAGPSVPVEVLGFDTIRDFRTTRRLVGLVPQESLLFPHLDVAGNLAFARRRASGKALALGERDGFSKIVADAVTGEILGAHLVGPEVTELLPELVLARTWELTPEEIARTVHAHPTLSEALMEAAHGVFGKVIHA